MEDKAHNMDYEDVLVVSTDRQAHSYSGFRLLLRLCWPVLANSTGTVQHPAAADELRDALPESVVILRLVPHAVMLVIQGAN